MLSSEARVDTDRPSRYLAQLCRHLSQIAQAHTDLRAQVEWPDSDGAVTFAWGRCNLHAAAGVLTLRAEADDEDALSRITRAVAGRIEQIGRRDGLAVSWSPPRHIAPDQREDSGAEREVP